MVTKSGFTLKNRGSVTLGTGSAQRHNVGLEFGGHTDRTGDYVSLSGFMSDRFLSPPSARSIHNTGRGLRSLGQLDFRANASDYFTVVMREIELRDLGDPQIGEGTSRPASQRQPTSVRRSSSLSAAMAISSPVISSIIEF